MPKSSKVKSRRMTLKQRYNVQKKIKDAQRKMKRAARTQPPKKIRKDPGIPNLFPYKERILRRIMGDQAPTQLEYETRQKLPASTDDQLAKSAFDAQKEIPVQHEVIDNGDDYATREKTIRRAAFKRELDAVIEQSDVLLEVLDARDPLGTRCPEAESRVADSNKQLVLVLNKIDLIPKEDAKAWLKYFRKEGTPVAIFKAATKGSGHIRRGGSGSIKDAGAAVGVDQLRRLLEEVTLTLDGAKAAVVAGVIGMPNVGKSSIINSIAGRRATGVAPIPGYTKKVSSVHITGRLRILDSPGVVLQARRGVVMREEKLVNPVELVSEMVDRAGLQPFLDAFKLEDRYRESMERWGRSCETIEDQVDTMLRALALQLGKVVKGGVPDIDQSARHVIRMWNRGRVSFSVKPPIAEEEVEEKAAILDGLAPAFNVDALFSGSLAALDDF
eukprot:gnl/Dysnectes_brevis/1239_a1383_5063.p1 GENE.gnl/Dysnectes_brevis/1239_a1383_5063~~gnl/Dysnectes_brevis/1239_a1383_5063.p1  ORF type:complete len:444 (-),score=59.60 gnl/Dysnectes_brevis/1239_a1383_5063:41-1372(-)